MPLQSYVCSPQPSLLCSVGTKEMKRSIARKGWGGKCGLKLSHLVLWG